MIWIIRLNGEAVDQAETYITALRIWDPFFRRAEMLQWAQATLTETL